MSTQTLAATRWRSLVACPVTGADLSPCPAPKQPDPALAELADAVSCALPGSSQTVEWCGSTDGTRFPVLGGIPLLLVDYAHDAHRSLALRSGVPLDELSFYNHVGFREAGNLDGGEVWHTIDPAAQRRRAGEALAGSFPGDTDTWIDAPYDGPAQLRCYRHLASKLPGGTVAQVGGTGTHAVKFLLAGAARAVVVTPILGEAVVAVACARRAGVSQDLVAVVGAAEDLPLAAASLTGIFCGGTLHHMDTAKAAGHFSRVLCGGGLVAAAEPWKVPLLHAGGTRLLGKREDVHCRPIDPARLNAFKRAFTGSVRTQRHGALTRYPLLALGKAGLRPRTSTLLRWMLADDRLSSLLQPVRALGGSVSLAATRAPLSSTTTERRAA